jgi:purine-binding chemotaxis protein CheW
MTINSATVDLKQMIGTEEAQLDLYLTFHLHDEDYGIAIHYVTEIIGIQKITPIPDLPVHIKGVINLRGRVIPVMDVRLRFGLIERAYDERTCVIVVDVNDQTTGLVVDRVNEVVEIGSDQIEPPPRHGAGAGGYIHGMGKIGDEVKILLNVDVLNRMDEALRATLEGEPARKWLDFRNLCQAEYVDP